MQMNLIIYDDGDLIIMREPNFGLSPIMALGLQKAQLAHAIYIKKDKVLYPVKHKSPQALVEFCEKYKINMHRTGPFEEAGPTAHKFSTTKDQFLFELKFGT